MNQTYDLLKSIRDLKASREILKGNLELFDKGNKSAYRVISVELRKLLCDGKNSLVVRLFPTAALHPHLSYRPGEDLTRLQFQLVGEWYFDGKGGASLERIFNQTVQPLALQEWLEQPFISGTITLKDFIRSVADKEGAHSDKVYNSTLNLARQVKIAREDIVSNLIVGIGRYLLDVIDMAIEQMPKHLQSVD